MDQYGKIFVVVVVLAVILIGVFIYLFILDRRIGKMEKFLKEQERNPTP